MVSVKDAAPQLLARKRIAVTGVSRRPQPPAKTKGGQSMQHTQPGPPAPSGTGLRSWKILAPLAPLLAAILWLAATFRLAMALLIAFHALIHTGFLTPEPGQNPAPRRGRSASTGPGSSPDSMPALG
jgi:hypothetical protein